MENENEVVVPNTTEEVTPEVTENTDGTVEETIDEIKARLSKAELLANNYKVRAEKAEKRAKEVQPSEERAKSDLSSKDIIALTRAGVSEDDMDEVIDFAKYKKISIVDALKHNTVKSLLKDKEEQRKSAEVANTSTARRGAVKPSDEEIIDKMVRGQLPEDPETLAKARWNLKKKK